MKGRCLFNLMRENDASYIFRMWTFDVSLRVSLVGGWVQGVVHRAESCSRAGNMASWALSPEQAFSKRKIKKEKREEKKKREREREEGKGARQRGVRKRGRSDGISVCVFARVALLCRLMAWLSFSLRSHIELRIAVSTRFLCSATEYS